MIWKTIVSSRCTKPLCARLLSPSADHIQLTSLLPREVNRTPLTQEITHKQRNHTLLLLQLTSTGNSVNTAQLIKMAVWWQIFQVREDKMGSIQWQQPNRWITIRLLIYLQVMKVLERLGALIDLCDTHTLSFTQITNKTILRSLRMLEFNLTSKHLTLKKRPKLSTLIVWKSQRLMLIHSKSLWLRSNKKRKQDYLKSSHLIQIRVPIKPHSQIGRTVKMTYSMRKNHSIPCTVYLLTVNLAINNLSQTNSWEN